MSNEANPSADNLPASGKTRRLFIGFTVEISQELSSALKKMRIGADKREIELHWVPLANYHITLNFLGSTPEDKIAGLETLIEKVCQEHAPFKTALKGVGGFPDDRHMRTLWVGVRHARALLALQEGLRAELVSSGFAQEARPYQAHLTIGKTRKARSATDLISPFVRTKFGDINVSTVILFESMQHGPHTTYEILREFQLNGIPRQFDSDWDD